MPELKSLGYVHTLKNNVINLLSTTNKSLYCDIAHNINVQFAQNMALQHEYFASYNIYIYIICIISFLKELYARVHAKNFKAVAQQEQSLVYRLLRPFNTETVRY